MPELPGTPKLYDKIEGLVNSLLFGVFFDKGINNLISAVPFLGWPVIKQVFVFGLRKVLEKMYAGSEEGIALLVIDKFEDAQREAFDEAKLKLKAEMEKLDAREEDLKKAEEDFVRRFNDLVNIRPK